MVMKIKSMLITVVFLVVVVGILVTIKGLQIGRMVAHGESFVPPPETVTVATVQSTQWESVLTAVGTLQAVQGVTLSAELVGRVSRIDFKSGTKVATGEVLVQQDISTESAERQSAQSELVLAKKNLDRSSELLPIHAIAKSDYDISKANYDKAQAQIDNINAVIAKKTIKAPFSGRLGIRQINLGQTLNVGQPIVSLQSLDPIYVNFLLPQQQLTVIKKGLSIRIIADALKGRKITGSITAINSEVDRPSHNIRIQGTLENPDEALRPGMFVNVELVLPEEKEVLAIPTTAVLFAPYSDSVFVVEKKNNDPNQALSARQQFVKLGEQRGDFVAVQSGLKPGEEVVSTGVFKLRNGQSVVVDNSTSPKFELNPKPEEA
jgi:membrane fusion protein, multidrug efflux system